MTNTENKKRSSNKTRAVSAPSHSKRESSFGVGILGFIALALSLFVFTSVLFPSGTGAVGGKIHDIVFGIFGAIGAYLVTFAVTAVLFFRGKFLKNGVSGRKMVLALVSSIALVIAAQLIVSGIPEFSGIDTIADLWNGGLSGNGGGVIGGGLAMMIGMLFGRTPATVICVAVCLVALSFTLGYTGMGIWASIAKYFRADQPARAVSDVSGKSRGINENAVTRDGSGRIDLSSVSASRVAADIVSPDREHGDALAAESENVKGDKIAIAPDIRGGALNTEIGASKAVDEIVTDARADEDFTDDTETDPFDQPAPGGGEKASEKIKKLVGKKKPSESGEKTAGKGRKNGNASDKKPTEDNAAHGAGNGGKDKDAGGEDDGVKRWEKGSKYAYPPTSLLNEVSEKKAVSEEEVQDVAERILRKLASFKVSARLVGYSIGPSITRYELAPGEGVRVSKISDLVKDLSLELASEGVRIEAPIPGKAAVGIEVPNKKASLVSFRSLAENPAFKKAKSKITVCVGQNVMGEPVFMDIDDMPHVLIAGQTKSGKSVAINCMLLSLFFRVSPDEVKLILIDPKRVELNIYGKIPHLIAPVVDEPTRAAAVLSWAVKEMERRYDLMEGFGARNRDEYMKARLSEPESEDFPQIVIVIDELADLMLQVKEHVEPLINRLAAKARACGIHLLIGTQRPSVDVLTGLIKANIPARISFKVAEQVDSRTIIGTKGAEKLLGKGDMLYQPTGSARVRVQGAFVEGAEINRVVNYIVEHNGEAAYDPEVMAQIEEEEKAMIPTSKKRGSVVEDDEALERGEKKLDPLFNDAVELAVRSQSVATSSLQRYLEIGYSRAAKLIDSMEKKGIVGPPNGSKPRRVLMDMQQYELWKMENNIYS